MTRKTKVEIVHVPKSEWPESVKQQSEILTTYAKQIRKATIAECKQLVREMRFEADPETRTYKRALDAVLTALENMK